MSLYGNGNDPETGDIVDDNAYQWTLTDQNQNVVMTSTGRVFHEPMYQLGTFTLTLTVKDPEGKTGSISTLVVVTELSSITQQQLDEFIGALNNLQSSDSNSKSTNGDNTSSSGLGFNLPLPTGTIFLALVLLVILIL